MNNNLLDKYTFSDGNITQILLDEDDVIVKFIQWDNKEIILKFLNCWKLINCKSIGIEIENVEIIRNSSMLEEIKKEIIETGGSEEESDKIFQISFFSSWGDNEVLVIIAEDFKII